MSKNRDIFQELFGPMPLRKIVGTSANIFEISKNFAEVNKEDAIPENIEEVDFEELED